MVEIEYRGRKLQCADGQSVLECLEQGGFEPPSSCREGHCQTCLMRATHGQIPPSAQVGLKDSWRAQGVFTACICHPGEDLRVVDLDDDVSVSATFVSRRRLAPRVFEIRIGAPASFAYRPGQFVTVIRPSDGVARPYSLASVPAIDDTLELHVRWIEGGVLSGWLCEGAREGDSLQLRGPSGDCIYACERSQPLLLIGTSTGLAPLLGVIRDALAHGHTGPLWLYHGSVRSDGLYLGEELRALARAHPNLRVTRRVLSGQAPVDGDVGALEDAVVAGDHDLGTTRAFVCGEAGFVSRMRRQLFVAGVPLRSIASDAFTPARA